MDNKLKEKSSINSICGIMMFTMENNFGLSFFLSKTKEQDPFKSAIFARPIQLFFLIYLFKWLFSILIYSYFKM